MRILPLWLSFFVLLQSGMAAACHSVGDVHVICHDNGIETVYVETEPQAQKPGGDGMVCCSALALADTHHAPTLQPLLATRPTAQQAARVLLLQRSLLPPPNRGPPAFSAL